MKIDERVSNYMALLQAELAGSSPRPNNTVISRDKEPSAAVTVDISSTALQRADDDARRERLNTIRKQLADGSYNISGKDVADKMLRILKS